MNKMAIRLLIVCIAHVLIFEGVCQLSVYCQREQTDELITLFFNFLLFLGLLIWAVLPGFKKSIIESCDLLAELLLLSCSLFACKRLITSTRGIFVQISVCIKSQPGCRSIQDSKKRQEQEFRKTCGNHQAIK